MRILFVHQNFPAQFRHVAAHLAAQPGHEIVYITHPGKPEIPGVRKVEYRPHRGVAAGVHPYLRTAEAAVLHGQGAARVALELKRTGFMPDVIVVHPGWGEGLFLKDVFPSVPMLSFCEFYYSGHGADVGFDPEFPTDFDAVCRTRIRNFPHLSAIEAADRGYSPTGWQRAQFPAVFQDRIKVIHDGIDCDLIRPDPERSIRLRRGVTLRRGDPVVTYVARNLEPYRGFHSFMRALPELFARRPDARVLIVGGDEVSYGKAPAGGGTWREALLAEVRPSLDQVHFLGKLPYLQYLQILQVSAVHVYLTYPFVLSWSMLEAMAAGCLVLGSATPPVEEVIVDGANGLLVDFFDTAAIARRAAEALEGGAAFAAVRATARATVLERYALADCRARLVALISGLA